MFLCCEIGITLLDNIFAVRLNLKFDPRWRLRPTIHLGFLLTHVVTILELLRLLILGTAILLLLKLLTILEKVLLTSEQRPRWLLLIVNEQFPIIGIHSNLIG